MFKGRRAYTGIDAGNRSVKLVRLEDGAGGRLHVSHWGVEAVPQNGEDGVEARGQSLAKLLDRLKLKPRQAGKVAASLGGPDVTVRQVTYPRLSPDEVRNSLPFEARKHLPLENVADPCLDCQILDPEAGESDDTMEVLLAAAPRKTRNDLLALLGHAGLTPDVVDLEPLPAVNAVLSAHPLASDDPSRIGILDVGGKTITLATTCSSCNFYSRTLAFDGNRLFSEDNGSVSFPAIGDLVREVIETVRFLSARNRENPLRSLYLVGGGAALDGIRDQLAQNLGIEVSLPDPFRERQINMDWTPEPVESAQLASAMGLALWWGDDV